MARVQYGSIITDMKGSIGGLSYQHNRSGKIVRVKPTPHRKSSLSQQSYQSVFTSIVRSWYALTLVQKEAWNTFADTYTKYNVWNEEKTLNGYNWFLSINNYLTLVGETPLISPPTYSTPLAVPSVMLVFEYDEVTINFSGGFAHTSEYLLLYTSPPVRNVSLYDRKLLRLTSIISPGTTTDYDFESEWESVHGITVPISGGDKSLHMIVGVLSVHETKGLASVYSMDIQEYNPS